MREKQLEGKVTRRTLLQSGILAATGLIGLQRLAQTMTSSSESVPMGECRVVTCYNEARGGHRCDLQSDPNGYRCIKEFYCQHFECNQAGKEDQDFDCEEVFGCPKDTGNNKFQCTGYDVLTADFNCYATGTGGNFTCNPGVRFSCLDFHCNPDKGKFNCVPTNEGKYQCSGSEYQCSEIEYKCVESVGTLVAYAVSIVPPEP